MSTPAIENIINFYIDIDITIIGSPGSIELIKNNPKVVKIIEIDSKNKYSFADFTGLGYFDVYFSFRGSIRAKFIKLIINAKKKYQFNQNKFPNRHQVEKYVDFVNQSLTTNFDSGKLVSYVAKSKINKSDGLIGINPGATYGSAKRWYPEKYAKIAIELSDRFNIIIFGGSNELDFAKEIEQILIKNDVNNFKNLAGKTSITELANSIAMLDLFITGDSGPMHIAASLQIPTIALFGPTNPIETSQWKNQNSIVLQKNLDCQPCLMRRCPLGHHNCMKLIKAKEVIDSIPKVI